MGNNPWHRSGRSGRRDRREAPRAVFGDTQFSGFDRRRTFRGTCFRIPGRKIRHGHEGAVPLLRGLPDGKVTYPVRVMKLMGIERLIVSNAAGGINPAHEIGDIMIIKDHINMIPEHPLRGRNIDALGPRFVDMKDAYNPDMIRTVEK